MGWTAMRPLQVKAIEVLSKSRDDLILSARTAAGKTEAAFLPILSHLDRTPRNSVQAVYVGPLRALINDQFRRLEDLCRRAEIPVHRWHGDVSAAQKKKLVSDPSGVLLITPESLESLFLNRTERLPALFFDLRYFVIDELHAMHGNERGVHLRSLLARLEAFTQSSPRYVALSATIGDLKLTQEWIRPAQPESVRVVTDSGDEKTIRFAVSAYLENPPMDDQSENATSKVDSWQTRLARDLYAWSSKGKNLIFANQRADVEWFADELNRLATEDGLASHYRVHHGSLSREVREQTERLMQDDRPRTTLCTSTLELGLDIGNVEAVGQIGCPFSVSSLVQRMGRSGRADGEPQVMRVAIPEKHLAPNADLEQRLRPRLLQIIALTELMLEKWTEPPPAPNGDFSTLVQQILSVIRQKGGVAAGELMQTLGRAGGFRWLTPSLLADVLRAIAEHDLVEQSPSNEIILGLKGEAIVGRYDFYAAFQTPEEYRVSQEGRLIGTLPAEVLPQEGQHILLAARRWRVTGVDHERRELAVAPSRARKPTRFVGDGGIVHKRVHHQMRVTLRGERFPSYLDPTASQLLNEVRLTAKQCGLDRSDLIPVSDSETIYVPWAGTKGLATLSLVLRRQRLNVEEGEFSLCVQAPQGQVVDAIAAFVRSPPSIDVLVQLAPPIHRRKYDQFLSHALLQRSFAHDMLDISDAIEAAATTLESQQAT